MNFKMENFRIGMNENGFHFQDSETGVIFTLRRADYGRLHIAICSETADKNVCESLSDTILGWMRKYGLAQGTIFLNIALEKCYISKNQDFVLKDFSGDGICIQHKKTNKTIGLMKIEKGVPVIGFDLESNYGYEEAVRDVFKLCSDSIQQIKAGTYHGKTFIKREDDIKTIRQELLRCLVEGVRSSALSKSSTEPEYEISLDRIIVKMDDFSKIKMKKIVNIWMVDERENTYPVRGLVYAIESVKRYPQQLNNVCYRYNFENKTFEVNITPENVKKVLKEVVKRRIIDLTV